MTLAAFSDVIQLFAMQCQTLSVVQYSLSLSMFGQQLKTYPFGHWLTPSNTVGAFFCYSGTTYKYHYLLSNSSFWPSLAVSVGTLTYAHTTQYTVLRLLLSSNTTDTHTHTLIKFKQQTCMNRPIQLMIQRHLHTKYKKERKKHTHTQQLQTKHKTADFHLKLNKWATFV